MAYVDVICTACAGKISLHENMKFGYCTLCGSRILLADAKAGKIDQSALKQLSGDDLYRLALEAGSEPKLMQLAAEKGSGEANLFIGTYHIGEEEYSTALPYLKKAAEAGIPNGKAGYATILLQVNNDPDEYPKIIKLAEEALKEGCDEGVGEVCKNLLNQLRPMVRARENQRRMDREYRRAREAGDYQAIKRLAEEGHPDAIEMVEYVHRKRVCRYYNNGLCNYKSTASFIWHCNDSRNAACSDYRMQD